VLTKQDTVVTRDGNASLSDFALGEDMIAFGETRGDVTSWIRLAVVSAGAMIGGATTFGLAAKVGDLWSISEAAAAAVFLIAAVWISAWHGTRYGFPPLPCRHGQVPRSWSRSLGGVFLFGATMGLGLATKVTTGLVHFALLLALLDGDVRVGVVAGLAFGLGRSAPLAVVFVVCRYPRDPTAYMTNASAPLPTFGASGNQRLAADAERCCSGRPYPSARFVGSVMTRKRWTHVWTATAFLLVVAACTPPEASTTTTSPATTAPIPAPATTTAALTPSPTTSVDSSELQSLVAERSCETKTGLSDGEALGDYVERSVRAGPVLFGNAATLDEIDIQHLAPIAGDRYGAIKVPLTVVAGHSAIVEIAVSARSWAALIYDRSAFADTYTLADGTPAAVFTACEDHDTFFNGGFIVTAPGCLEMAVTEDEQSVTVQIPIGPADCAAA